MRTLVFFIGSTFLLGVSTIAIAQEPGKSPKEQDQEEAARLLLKARETINGITNPFDREDMTARIARLQENLGNTATAESLILSLGNESLQNIGLCNLALRAARQGDLQEGLAKANGIQYEASRNSCLEQIGAIQANKGDTSIAMLAASRYEKPSMRADALMDIAVSLVAEKHTEIAAQLYDLAAKAADSIPAEEEKSKIIADIGSRRSWGDPNGAYGMLPQLQDALKKTKDETLRKDLIRAIVDVQAAKGMIADAFKSAELASNPDLQAQLILEISWAQVDLGDIDGALNTLREIPDPSLKDGALDRIAMFQVYESEPDAALRTISMMTEDAIGPWIYDGIATTLAKAGCLDEAVSVARRIPDPYFRADGLISVAGLVHGNDIQTASRAILEEAAALVPEIQLEGSRPEILHQIAAVQAAQDDLAASFKTMNAMPDDITVDAATKPKTSVKENLAYWQCMNGEKLDALKWLETESSPLARAYILIGIIEATLGQDPPATNNVLYTDKVY